jgi:predicted  nucleic acid-binding Zn-ribbon protein
MESGLELLVKLQQLDAEIESVRDELERIPQELRIADEELAQARTDLDSFEEELAGIVAGQKDCERKKVESKALLTDYRNKLLSIRTNDEYRAMLGQIGFVEKQIDDLDSRTIELMYAEDEARGREGRRGAAPEGRMRGMHDQRASTERSGDRAGGNLQLPHMRPFRRLFVPDQ